jgi:hypothetical protein
MEERRTVVVVLGAPLLADGTPGPDLKQRLECALALAREGQLVVVTGGAPKTYGSSGVRAEGQAGRDFLLAHGKPSEDVAVEDTAMHTFDNALLTRALLKRRPDWPRRTRLVVVTHDWHVERSRLCFEAVFGRDQHVQLEMHSVPSDPCDPIVLERKTKEASIIASKWVERMATATQNHFGMQ